MPLANRDWRQGRPRIARILPGYPSSAARAASAVTATASSAASRDAELFQFLRDNQIPWLMKTFAGILPSGEEIAEGHAAFLYRLFRGYEHVFAQDPRRFDEMIRLQFPENPKS